MVWHSPIKRARSVTFQRLLTICSLSMSVLCTSPYTLLFMHPPSLLIPCLLFFSLRLHLSPLNFCFYFLKSVFYLIRWCNIILGVEPSTCMCRLTTRCCVFYLKPCQASGGMSGLRGHVRSEGACQASGGMSGLRGHVRPEGACQA